MHIPEGIIETITVEMFRSIFEGNFGEVAEEMFKVILGGITYLGILWENFKRILEDSVGIAEVMSKDIFGKNF